MRDNPVLLSAQTEEIYQAKVKPKPVNSWQSGKLKRASSLNRLYRTEAICGLNFLEVRSCLLKSPV